MTNDKSILKIISEYEWMIYVCIYYIAYAFQLANIKILIKKLSW